jgi:hypothetical protein
LLNPKQQARATKTVTGKSGLEWWRRAEEVVGTFTVSIVEYVGEEAVAGEKLQVAPAGSPDEQAKDTGAMKPYSGVTVIVAVSLPPGGAINDLFTTKAKSGATFMV